MPKSWRFLAQTKQPVGPFHLEIINYFNRIVFFKIWHLLCEYLLVMRIKRQHLWKSKGQALVEFALLIPIVAAFFFSATLFYQSYVQENLYGSNAQYERFMDGENPSLGQEMIVGLPIP